MPENRRRRVRRVLLGLLVVVLLLGWAGYHVLQGGRELQAARDGLVAARAQLAAGSDARAGLAGAAGRTERARDHLDDPVVRLLSVVPLLGDPLQSARGLATAADLTVRDGLLPLLTAAGPDPAGQLLAGAGRIDVDYLAAMAAPTADAARALGRAERALREAPEQTRISRLDEARQELAAELDDLRALVDDAALGTEVAPDLLGRGGLRRYLVLSQSPAEARGTGGLIGGYTLVEAADGEVRVLRSGPRSELDSPGRSVVDLGPEYDRHYGVNGPTLGWINSNLSPHFPYTGQIWTALWERQFPEQLDGALVLDPVSLSYLLAATGPVRLPGTGDQVDAGNVVDTTLRDVYARFDDDLVRDAYLQSVSAAVTTALTTRDVPGRALVDGLRRAVEERRLRLWLRDPPLQQVIADRALAGALPEGARAVGDVVVDAAGSKLDYYLERALDYRAGCGQPSRLTLTLTNAAPASGLPDYVTPEKLRRGRPPGTNRLIVTLYLPAGASNVVLRVAGQEVPAARTGTELGLVWVEAAVELEPGQSAAVEADFLESDPAGPLRRVIQPLVRPERFTATSC